MRKPAFGFFVEAEKDHISNLELLRLKLCYANGIDAVCFCKNDTDFENKTINAYLWTKDGLKREVTQLPVLLEYGTGVEYRKFFRENSTIIDDFNLSKKAINDLLLNTEFANTVIPSLCTAISQKVLNFSMMWKETIVKPLKGARGEGIISVRLNANGNYVFTDKQKELGVFTQQEAIEFLENLYTDKKPVIVQPRMNFTNKDGYIMDFRVNVSKNGKGEWETIFILPRTSRGSIVSNISNGGYASELLPTLNADYGENAEKVRAQLNRIATKLPPIVEEASACNMLSLGIDVGFDYETLNPYIIEVNYVPQVHFKGNLQYYYKQSEYITYLVNKYNLR